MLNKTENVPGVTSAFSRCSGNAPSSGVARGADRTWGAEYHPLIIECHPVPSAPSNNATIKIIKQYIKKINQ